MRSKQASLEHFSNGPLEAFSSKHYSARIWSHLKPSHRTKTRFEPSLAGWLVANAQPTFMFCRLVTQYLFGQIGQIRRQSISPTFNFADFQFFRLSILPNLTNFLHIRTKRVFVESPPSYWQPRETRKLAAKDSGKKIQCCMWRQLACSQDSAVLSFMSGISNSYWTF